MSSIRAQRERNRRTKLKIDTLPYSHVRILTDSDNVKSKMNIKYMDFFFLVLDDHSRVILKNVTSDQGGYINANYIEASI